MDSRFETFIYRMENGFIMVELRYQGFVTGTIMFGSEKAFKGFTNALLVDIEAHREEKKWSPQMLKEIGDCLDN